MFGVLVEEGIAIPWLLTTTTVDRYPLAFWRASKHVIAQLREVFPFLVQQVDGRYSQALRWAARLGFEVCGAQPFGVDKLPFHPIVLRGAACANH